MRKVLIAVAVVGAAILGVERGEAQSAFGLPVDLELVIAVDVSRSMDAEEFGLQRSGYVQAIRDPEFVRAITSGGSGRIALTYVEWSGRFDQKVVVAWRMIDGAAAAGSFAAALEDEPLDTGRGTSISAALDFSAALFTANGYDGERRVIDVSGDGPNNYGPPVVEARDAAVAKGIVINGLPILIRPSPIVPDIAGYYEDCVIGGGGAFVLPVSAVDEFAEAIRRKLVLEVAGGRGRDVIQVSARQPSDCLAGEKAREDTTGKSCPELDN